MRRLGVLVISAGLVTALVLAGSSNRSAAVTRSGIDVKSLRGKILFTRAGHKYGDETVFTASAGGTHQRRITGFGKTCCIRWSPDGRHVLIAAQAPDGRITAGVKAVSDTA